MWPFKKKEVNLDQVSVDALKTALKEDRQAQQEESEQTKQEIAAQIKEQEARAKEAKVKALKSRRPTAERHVLEMRRYLHKREGLSGIKLIRVNAAIAERQNRAGGLGYYVEATIEAVDDFLDGG